jgi:hypothetical protein
MRKTLPIVALVCLLVVPAAHAAEPTGTPKNAAQWCKAWKSGEETAKFAELFPNNTGFVQTFTQKRGNGLAKKNLFGRCVSLTASKLAAVPRAGSASASVAARCKADLARDGSAYTNVGRCVSDGGLQVRP